MYKTSKRNENWVLILGLIYIIAMVLVMVYFTLVTP